MSLATDLIGQVLGGYKLVEVIGSGSVATVFKAYQPTLERWVAIKVLHYKDSNTILRFEREAIAIAQLRHRNILIVYDHGEEGDWPYIIMEYVPGGTLKDVVSGQPMSWSKAVNLMSPVADALSYAHSQGIIHRDVKPSNILLPQPDWPLLADFGLVKLVGAMQQITGTGVSLGTPAYIAPEQARSSDVDHRSDLYSFGVILFQLVTGRLPFDYAHPNKMLLAHISEPVPNPRRFNAECPVALESIILTCLQKNPDDRYVNMNEVITALYAIAGDEAGIPPPPVSEQPAPARLPKQRQETVLFRPKTTEEAPKSSASIEDTAPSLPKPSPPVQPEPIPETKIFIDAGNITVDVPRKDSVIIGRTHKTAVADVNLAPYGAAQVGVSRHHARLIWQEGQWLIDDMGSLNGTFVNEVQVTPGQPVLLKDGDTIRCSHMSFVFLIGSGE